MVQCQGLLGMGWCSPVSPAVAADRGLHRPYRFRTPASFVARAQMLASWQHQGMREISFEVADYPPAKSEAKSMLAGGHVHAGRVLALLEAARVAIGDDPQPLFPTDALGLEVVLETPTQPPSDATNYLGGIADVLEAKGHRGNLEHLGDLAFVALYTKDRQIQEVHYRWLRRVDRRYRVRLWALE